VNKEKEGITEGRRRKEKEAMEQVVCS